MAARARASYCMGGLAVAALASMVSVALAAPDIGQAISIAPQVSGAVAGRAAPVAVGDGVVEDEVIRTAAAGSARLRFVDATDLSIGPSSSVTLDRFVFDPNGGAKSFVLVASRGVFRFATGNSNHDAYAIRTPAAVIGVRGTRFYFNVAGTQMRLSVTEGRVIVCPNGLPQSSCYEASAGQTVDAQAGRPVVVLTNAGPSAPPPNLAPPPPIYTPVEPAPLYEPWPHRRWPMHGVYPRWPRSQPGDVPPRRGAGPYLPRRFGGSPPFGARGGHASAAAALAGATRRSGRHPGLIWPPYGR